MSDEESVEDAGKVGSSASSEFDDLQFILQETRVLLLQQILAHETGALSVEELKYRNKDISEENIRYHLRELRDRGIIKANEIPKGERKRDLPNTFFSVTEEGARILKRANLFEEITVYIQIYDQMERTDRIDEIETMETRPIPDLNFSRDDLGIKQSPSSTDKEVSEGDTEVSQESKNENPNDSIPQIVIVGCGGAGNNTVNRLYNIGVSGADTVALNTDKEHLEMIEADTKILVGKSLTNGLGAGGDPSMGERATEMARNKIKDVLGDADFVFVTAGMGGGTGTGAAPIVSKIAKEQGAIVVGMVSTPFNVERARTVKAEEGLEHLRNEADSIIVLDNNRLLDYVPNLPIGKAFSVMDQIIAETVKSISETITQPSLINFDYADIADILDSGGVAVMLVGETQDKNKSQEVVKDAMNHPLLDVDYRGASGGLVHITGGPDLTLKEAEGIADDITERLETSANVIWGARIREEYKGRVRVMAIMTGVQSAQVLGPSTQKQAERSRAAGDASDLDSPSWGAVGDGGRHIAEGLSVHRDDTEAGEQ